MKKVYMALLLVFLIPACSDAHITRTVTLHFAGSDFTLDEFPDGMHIRTSKYASVLQQDTLAPALPFVCVNILIGADESFCSFSVNTLEEEFGEDIEMAPNPVRFFNDGSAALKPLNKVLFSASSYPSANVEYTGQHEMNGYRFVTFLVCPFTYDTRNGLLSLAYQIDIQMLLSSNSRNISLPDKERTELIRNFVANPEDLDSLYSCINGTKSGTINTDTLCKYLIVTCDSLKSEFQRLADWKKEKGVWSKVITVEDIYSNYTTGNNPLKIKTAIKDEYENSEHKLEYVLLAGLSTIVPSQECYAEAMIEGSLRSGRAESDIYYACLNDLDWNSNHNSKYGELGDSVDVTPIVTVTRLPANNRYSAQHIVDRVLEYEINPNTCNWKNEILMAGVERIGYFTIGGVTQSDAQYASESMYSDYIASTEWGGQRFRFYDTYTDHPDGADYDVTEGNMQTELSKGYAFVNTTTHGTIAYWVMEIGDNYDYNIAYELENPRYSLITTGACLTNNIYASWSLGPSFMLNPNSGIIGYYGCTERAIGSAGLGPVEEYTGGLYNILFTLNNHLGKTVKESKESYLAACYQQYSDYRWHHFFMNALCDPEMPVYTVKPLSFSDLDFTYSNNTFRVDASNCFNLSMMSRHDGGVSFYKVEENIYSKHSSELLPDESILCFTRTNHIPYRTIFGKDVYLQNEALSNNLNVTATNIYIGSNVTNDRTQGPVTVENGKSIIRSKNGVTINNDFEVKLGATVEITTN